MNAGLLYLRRAVHAGCKLVVSSACSFALSCASALPAPADAQAAPAAQAQPSSQLRALLEFSAAQLPEARVESFVIASDRKTFQERLRFLDRDFKSTAFRIARTGAEASLLSDELHLGIFEAEFATCRQLRAAMAALTKSSRFNFRIPVLTTFRYVARRHSLLIIYSETNQRDDVQQLMAALETFRPAERACEGDGARAPGPTAPRTSLPHSQ